MANEMTLVGTVTVSNGNFKFVWRPGALSVDQTNGRVSGGVQTIGTSAETVTIGGDITSYGYMVVRNLDATNFVTIGPDSTGQVDFLKLLAGEWGVFPIKPGITIKATADTAACDLEYYVLDR